MGQYKWLSVADSKGVQLSLEPNFNPAGKIAEYALSRHKALNFPKNPCSWAPLSSRNFPTRAGTGSSCTNRLPLELVLELRHRHPFSRKSNPFTL